MHDGTARVGIAQDSKGKERDRSDVTVKLEAAFACWGWEGSFGTRYQHLGQSAQGRARQRHTF